MLGTVPAESDEVVEKDWIGWVGIMPEDIVICRWFGNENLKCRLNNVGEGREKKAVDHKRQLKFHLEEFNI